ncbi:MAG: 4Fe-4S binding protein [Phycisphaerae bacterium]|nr:4Fe-4S binding protein [Phycisphaerae bacterium]
MIGDLDEKGVRRSGNEFVREPARGAVAAIHLQFKVPKIDTELCIGCGICELECPVVGDRRAVYVTAEGETRSQRYRERDRNRSLRLMKTADAGEVTRRSVLGLNPHTTDLIALWRDRWA